MAELSEIDTSTPAVVLKLDRNVMHHGGLGIIRSLGRLGVPMYGVLETALAPGAHSRYLHGRWIWRAPAGDPERLVLGLRQLAERIGTPAVLIPTDDAGAIFLAEHGDDLREWYRFAAPPADLPRRLAGKDSMYRLCDELGVACPHRVLPSSWEQARDFAEDTGFPLVAKLAHPWRTTKKLRSTTLVHTCEQLRELYRSVPPQENGELLLQEFIPGAGDGDWIFHGYCDARSICRSAHTGIKLRSYPARTGLTSYGRAVENEQLRTHVVDLLARVGFRGIVDMDFRQDSADGQYKLLDFNPRIGAQFRLFRDTAGVDVALAAYLDLTGQRIPEGAPVTGRGFVVENYEPITALREWRSGSLGLASWVASLRGVDEFAWFARDDMVPFGLMCARMGWRALNQSLHRERREAAWTWPRYRPGRAARI